MKLPMGNAKRLLAGLAIAALLGILFVNAPSVDHVRHTEALTALSKLQELDARMDEIVLKHRFGLVNNYDSLVATLGSIKRYKNELEQGDHAIAGLGDPEIDRAMADFSGALAAKEVVLERFKSRNAVLRNSSYYFPLAVDKLSRDPRVPGALRAQAESLLRQVLLLRISAPAGEYESVARALQAIEGKRGDYPAPVRGLLQDVIQHARKILDYEQEVNQLVMTITSAQAEPLGRKLTQSYSRSFERDLARANAYRFFLFLSSLALLAYAVDSFLRLRKNAARLKGTLEEQTREIARREKAEQESRQTEERYAYLAQYDTLTGLPNRNLFRDRLSLAASKAKRNHQMLALMFIDLDRFKEINDTLGHAIGDKVLQAVATLLKKSLRESDTVARLGGDEFTIILEGITDSDQVTTMAEKVRQILAGHVVTEGGHDVFITASIGITLYPLDADNVDALVQTADVAMYHAKEEGRNTYAFYAPQLNAQAAGRLRMEGLLRRALERNEFAVHYQPKVDVQSGRITGMEALIRWNSKELGFVSPGQFIPVAEKSGLIVPIGKWILEAACVQNKACQDLGFPSLLVSVNLSPRQFREKNLVEMIAGVLADTGLEPRFLDLEITEGMVMHDAEKVIALLERLHQLGIQLSVDDFGTGYSSLAYLKRFPVQTLKIDQSFVRDLSGAGDDAGIVKAIIAMADSLKLGVVAEGVETKEQLACLANLNCDQYQGYYFSKPVPAADFVKILQRDRSPAEGLRQG